MTGKTEMISISGGLSAAIPEVFMQNCVLSEKLSVFHRMNELVRPGGIVFFGSTGASCLPLGEINQEFDVDLHVYNSSIEGLLAADAESVLEACVIELQPSRVFLMLGDADVVRADFDAEGFLEKYRWLLYTLHNSCRASLHIVSVLSEDPAVPFVNRKLKALAEETGCVYVDGYVPAVSPKPVHHLLSVLCAYMRSGPIRFVQAMGI